MIERTQHNPIIKSILSIITAAKAGVILNLTVYLGRAVIFPEPGNYTHADYFSLTWIVVSIVAMYRLKVVMIPWIGMSVLAGLIYFLLSEMV